MQTRVMIFGRPEHPVTQRCRWSRVWGDGVCSVKSPKTPNPSRAAGFFTSCCTLLDRASLEQRG
eukprot:scaffold28824_cov101-Phaeocystis_antarctica.AAC.1